MKSNRLIAPPDHWPRLQFDADHMLDVQQQSVLDFHSLINLMNIIGLTAQYWEMEHARTDASNHVINEDIPKIQNWIKAHETLDPKDVLDLCKNLQQAFKVFVCDISNNEREDPNSPLLHVDHLLEMMEVQIADIELMIHHQEPWRKVRFEEIEGRLSQFFASMEKHAKGRFFIRFQASAREETLETEKSYDITFSLQGESGNSRTTLDIPTHFLSTIQDLMANARKYSPVGSTIRADLSRAGGEWTFTILDNGFGIEEDELDKVVQYGYRGRNSLQKPTLGAGCGLTKAVRLCQQYSGIFQLASKHQEGTWIQIKLPETIPVA